MPALQRSSVPSAGGIILFRRLGYVAGSAGLAFCDDPARRERLLRFASWIEGDSGLTTAVRIIEGNLRPRDKAESELKAFIAQNESKMFARAIAAPDFRVGADALLQSFGVGKIQANMALSRKVYQLPVGDQSDDQFQHGNELHEAMRLGRNDAQVREWNAIQAAPVAAKRIDVWRWGGRNSHLSL